MRRVAVVGCIGAGKSAMARALGEKLEIEVFHLDRLWWEPGEYRITGKRTVAERTMAEHDFRLLQEEIAGRDSWIIDGGAADLDVRLSRADAVVFLDPPRWLCTWQLVMRHNRRRPDYPDGVREGIGWFLFLARWIWRTYPTKRRPAILKAIAERGGGAQVFWLRTLARCARSSTASNALRRHGERISTGGPLRAVRSRFGLFSHRYIERLICGAPDRHRGRSPLQHGPTCSRKAAMSAISQASATFPSRR